jgi:cell cycle sensor histidine kinase DivJ
MLLLGIFAAVIGGAAAASGGGALGFGVGGAAFVIILLALFFIFAQRTNATAPMVASDEEGSRLDTEMPDIMAIEVSELGRIRGIRGRRDLIPHLKPGQIAEDVLVDQAGRSFVHGMTTRVAGREVSVIRGRRASGEVIFILPALEMLDISKQKLRERTNFFAGLGHDLKSPLNAVIGFSEIMDAEIKGPMPEGYREYPGLIRESADTLLRFVEDMLGFAKSEAGTYEIDKATMDIAASGETVFRQSKAVAERAGVTLVFNGTGEVLAVADARAVQRIWDNLVSNAIKYSRKGGRVEMCARSEKANAIISVTDHGAGMSAEDLALVATPFEQGANARGRAGTGLGLAMVKKLVEMHGGSVAIKTALGEGTQVTVILPTGIIAMKKAAE